MAKNDKYIQALIESIKKKEKGAEIPTYDPAKQAEGLERRLEGSGVTAEKRDSRNFVEKALNLTPKQNVLFDIFEIINRPQQMLFQGIKAGQEGEDVGKAVRKGFGGVGEDVRFKEILQNAGMEDSGKDIGADDIFGFAGDVLVDPIDLALLVATPFTGGASGAALAAKKGIQQADNAIDIFQKTSKAVDTMKLAGVAEDSADYIKAAKNLEKARVLADKANKQKVLWQNLDDAAKKLNDIRTTAKKGGSPDGLADAFDAYKAAVKPLKKRMTPLEYTFKQAKGGIKKSINLLDNGLTGTLSKLDGFIHNSQIEKLENAVTPKVAESLRESFKAIQPWSKRYSDMKVAFNSIFDAAKALPDGLWSKTKQITGSRKQAMARMVKLNQLNIDDIAQVAKVTGKNPEDITQMLMRAYEYEKYNPTTKLADLFDLDFITNHPMTADNYKIFKDYIYDTLKGEGGFSKYPYNQIDALFEKRTLENGVEAWFVRPDIKNQAYTKDMLKDMRKYMDDSVKGFEKADIRIEKLQKRIAEVDEIRAKAADEILATAGRYIQDADGTVKVVLTTDEVADLKKLGINFKDGSVVSHDQALKAINGRIKKTTEKIKEIDDSDVVYHGTNAEFDTFKRVDAKTKQVEGDGFYFSTNVKDAENYGKNVKKARVTIKKPISDDTVFTLEEANDILDYFKNHPKADAALKKLEVTEYELKNPTDLLKSIQMNWGNDRDEFYKLLRERFGYDGYISNSANGSWKVAFNADQIEDITDAANVGYHRGDLGKAESMSQQYGSSRGTGHFGTGTYFTGTDSLAGSSVYGERPLKKVNFNNYKLYKPKNEYQGIEAHKFLKKINSVYDIEDLKKLDAIDAKYRIDPTISTEKYQEALDKVKETFKKYKKLSEKNLTPEEKLLISEGRMSNSNMYDVIKDKDSLSTVFMKALGFEGVDVRHIKELDDSTFGSVIYDLRRADDITDAGKVKIGKKLYEPEDAKKHLTAFNEKLNTAKSKLEADKIKYNKVAKNANLKTTKLSSKLDEVRKTRPNTTFEDEIKSSRYYSDTDINEVTQFFEKNPELTELKQTFNKRYDAMYEDLNATMGVALKDKFDDGYLRHVKSNEMRNFLNNLDDSKRAYLKDTSLVGDTTKFKGRNFQMSAYEANIVGREIKQNILDNGKLSDEMKEIVTELSVIDMFEEDATNSVWEFISQGTSVIEKGQKIEEVMKTAWRGGTTSMLDETLLKPFESIKDIDNATHQIIESKELIKKLEELSFTFKDEELMAELAKYLGENPQMVIDKNLYNLISFNTSKDINAFADNMVKIIDSTNTMFKKYKLLSPGFQIRNLIGNMTNILLSGVNPLKILDNNVIAHRVLSQGDELLMKRAKGLPLSGGETQMLDMFEEFTREGFDQVFGAGNIENLASVYDIPDDIMKAMRSEAKPKNLLKRAMRFNGRMNEVVDRQFRMSAFIYAKQNPEILSRVGVTTPAEFVRKVLFDPNDLSKVERQYLKRLIPFYTFTKKNLAYQMRNVFDNPNRYNKLIKSVDASWAMLGIDPKTEVEQYKRENMWIPVFVNKNGEYKALKANLPVGDFAEFLGDPLKKIVSSTAPAIRTPFELTMNTQAFTGMPIQEFKGQRGYQIPWLPRKAEYGLSQLGLDVPIAAVTDIAQGTGQAVGGDVLGGIEKGIGRSFLSSGSVEKARLSRDYDRLNELRDLMRYYKQEGVKILTLDEIESMQQQKSQTILQRIRALGRT